jgi:hypothetical protein
MCFITKFILLGPPSRPPKLARQGRAGEGGSLELVERAKAAMPLGSVKSRFLLDEDGLGSAFSLQSKHLTLFCDPDDFLSITK